MRPRTARRIPLRARITLLAVVVVAGALGTAAGTIVWAVERNLLERAEDQLATELDRAARLISEGEADAERLADDGPGAVDVEVVEPGGGDGGAGPARRIVHPPGAGDPPAPPVPTPTEGGLIAFRQVDTEDGTLTIVGTHSLVTVVEGVDSVVRALQLAMPVLLLVVGVLCWFLVGRSLRPVEAMRLEVEDITHSTLDRRVAAPGTRDELDRLARTLNEMLDDLQQAVRRQREFVSDASHELRSPLAALRVSAEVALRHPQTTDLPGVANEVLSATDRLDHLVDDLLLAARLEEGQSRRAVVTLDTLVQEEAARPRPGPSPRLRAEPVQLWGDEGQLRRAVGNLLDNACRYARDHVDVTVDQHEGHAVVLVDDDGPGIPEADRERMFERFTRLDEGRGRATGGAGLGLFLVRRVALAHGGRAGLERSPLGGTRAVLALPAYDSSADAERSDGGDQSESSRSGDPSPGKPA